MAELVGRGFGRAQVLFGHRGGKAWPGGCFVGIQASMGRLPPNERGKASELADCLYPPQPQSSRPEGRARLCRWARRLSPSTSQVSSDVPDHPLRSQLLRHFHVRSRRQPHLLGVQGVGLRHQLSGGRHRGVEGLGPGRGLPRSGGQPRRDQHHRLEALRPQLWCLGFLLVHRRAALWGADRRLLHAAAPRVHTAELLGAAGRGAGGVARHLRGLQVRQPRGQGQAAPIPGGRGPPLRCQRRLGHAGSSNERSKGEGGTAGYAQQGGKFQVSRPGT
mmetsp:Transcript_88650/g.211671  ORF Transcript_88650/g.211671 Transcript_88650/m.211671 type:complete len:276 (-) Transcript_88650:2633-3460(-)